MIHNITNLMNLLLLIFSKRTKIYLQAFRLITWQDNRNYIFHEPVIKYVVDHFISQNGFSQQEAATFLCNRKSHLILKLNKSHILL